METKKIEIDLDVHKEIEKRRMPGETSNHVLRRLFNLEPRALSQDDPLFQEGRGGLYKDGVWFPEGTKLMALYKGHQKIAYVGDDEIIYEGRGYPSLSAVAGAVTGTPVNGWTFWLYDEIGNGHWKAVNALREG